MSAPHSIYAAILIAIFLTTGPALGGGNGNRKGKIPDAQALIDKCWAISLDQRSTSSIQLNRRGHLRTVLCLENSILEQIKIFDFSKYTLTEEQAREKLKELRFSVGKLYWAIFNENPGCVPTCGTIYHTRHLWEIAKTLERMLKIMIGRRKEYKF